MSRSRAYSGCSKNAVSVRLFKQIIVIGGDVALGHFFYPHPVPVTEQQKHSACPGCYALSKVLEEDVVPVSGNIQVQSSFVVEIGHGNTHTPTEARQSSGLGNVRKATVRALVIKRHHRIATVAEVVNRRAIHHHDVQPVVVVAVKESYSTAHRFDDVFLIWRRDVRNSKPSLRRDVLKHRRRGHAFRC